MTTVKTLEKKLDALNGSKQPATFIIFSVDNMDGEPPRIESIREHRGQSTRLISEEEYKRVITDKDEVINFVDDIKCKIK